MSSNSDCLYPDFLRTGLGRLHKLGVGHDLLALFSALDHFRRDLQEVHETPDILRVAYRYVAGLDLFDTQAFYLVDGADLSFVPVFCEPESARPDVEKIIQEKIRQGKFAQALRQNAPMMFETAIGRAPVRSVLHSLGIATQTVGMFCGLLRSAAVPDQEVVSCVLSMLLGNTADALAAARKTADLKHQIRTLTGLLPICAWCKKVRDDQGYWKQIETYIESHSDATFSHGVCPECTKSFLSSPRG